MTIILSALAGLILGGGATHAYHVYKAKKSTLKVSPRDTTGSGGQPGGGH